MLFVSTLNVLKNKTIVSAALNKIKRSFYILFCFLKSLFWSICKIKLSIQSSICLFGVFLVPGLKLLPFYSQHFVYEDILRVLNIFSVFCFDVLLVDISA